MTRHRAARDTSAVPARGRGVTFIEIVVAITLVGTVVIGILAATQASIRASRVSREAARVESALLAGAYGIERLPRDDRCNTAAFDVIVENAAELELRVAAGEAPNHAWIDQAEHLTVDGWTTGICPGSEVESGLVQRIRITMRSPDGALERTLEVVTGDT